MWCEQCQSDVATQIAADGQSLLCTSCGQPVRRDFVPSLHPETKSAREFLERWAQEQEAARAGEETSESQPAELGNASPPDSGVPETAASEKHTSTREEDQPVKEQTPSPVKKPKFRIDGEHSGPSGPIPSGPRHRRRPRTLEKVTAEESSPLETSSSESPTPETVHRQRRTRIDAEHVTAGPHFDVRTAAPQRTVFPGRAEAIWGQLLAYAGVGLLTVGTVLVLWGYFGGLEQYASTGWLVSTAGQMLLLLGIVTLVAGGMQQTTHEVSQRIDHLGGRIIRIEESTDKILKGPHFHRSRRKRQTGTEAVAGDQDAA